MVSALMVIPFFNIFVSKFKNIPKILLPIGYLGKASYHIYFAQMIYYYLSWYYYTSGIFIDFTHNRIVSFLIGSMICVVFGILFYIVESKLSKIIKDRYSAKLLNIKIN